VSDMTPAIQPKATELTADHLLSGPRTIKITSVDVQPGTERPVTIHYEGDDGLPFKPCKTVSRILVNAWGPDAKLYAGRSITLYRDPDVKWGGLAVGGLRASHLSHIDGKLVLAVTVTKGNKKPVTILPLVATKTEKTDDPATIEFITDQLKLCPDLEKLGAEWKRLSADVKKLTPAGQAAVTKVKDDRKLELQGAQHP
jgi:hypothetical protein